MIHLYRLLALTAVLLTVVIALQAINIEQKTPAIISGLTDSLNLSHPVILDIRCGEWTPAIEREMRSALLKQGVDLRETNIGIGMFKDSNELLPLATESDFGVNGKMFLDMLNLKQADLLELSMEQSIETGEKRNIFSYARYKTPVYRFELKQISLPDQKLVAYKEIRLAGTPEIENPGSLLAMKWYEPIIASAILGSMVLMLWTLK